ncbi:unnamed protein product [Linum trigynum]|uniref:Endonuclease/exonuclease/phosphatase domain-containing protein n=1 Tax=Linum trigynum TaxID=586398 RepID=A0AAV2DVV7_9ROSI
MGFDGVLVVDAVGFPRGIWLLWDSSIVHIVEAGRSSQFLLVRGKIGATEWYFTTVYGSPTLVQHGALWDSLRDIATNMSNPWLLCGDFNSLLHASEKFGAVDFDASCVREFQDCLLDTRLIDLQFTGPLFTWF